MKYIIVPVADTNEKCKGFLENLLDSIRAGGYYENDYHTVLCYDNCSKEFQDYFRLKYSGDRIVAIDNQNDKNLNFAANSNTGLRVALEASRSTGGLDDHFIIQNMDTILPHHIFFDTVLGEGMSFPNPVDNPEIMQEDPANLATPVSRVPVTRFSGFCMCFSRKLLDKIGVFDEHFPGSFNDDEIAARALLAGFPVEVVGVNVHHEMKDRKEPSNTGAYDHAELGLGLHKYRRKWSIPAQVPHEQFNQWILDSYKWDEAMKCH